MFNGKHGIHAVYLNQSWPGLPVLHIIIIVQGNLMKFANKHHQVVDGGSDYSKWTWEGVSLDSVGWLRVPRASVDLWT